MHAHTITTVLLIGGAWFGVVLLVLSLLTVAKRSDEAMDRELRDDGSLGDVAREVHWALGAERVTVVVTDPYEPATGQVGACVGAPGLVGRRVRVAPALGTGVVRPAEAVGLGLAGAGECPAAWTFAHVPLAG